MALQVRRGTNAERLGITPAEGELIFTTDTKQLYVGDGSTAGGITSIAGTIDSLLADTTPQLGGGLDLNNFDITGTGNINITGNIQATGNINLGDGVGSDVLNLGAEISGSIIPNTDSAHNIGTGLKYWNENIHDLLQAECKKLKEDLPVKNVSDEERYRLTLEQADPPEMKQWQTMRYYLMDLTTPNEQMLLSSEAASLKIDIDLSWINDHREKFLRPWKDLLHSVEQKLNEMKDDSNSASI